MGTSEIKAHTAQLQKIGVNVNQIAKRINETGHIYTDDMDEIKRLMDKVWKLERRLLLQFKGFTKCMLATKLQTLISKERTGMEQKQILKSGHIVVKNPLAYELPKREVVIKPGRTLYRFTGSYDGQRALK